MDEDKAYLPIRPATFISFEVKPRDRPCWRCRLHLRWPPWRVHWQCRPAPKLTYLP